MKIEDLSYEIGLFCREKTGKDLHDTIEALATCLVSESVCGILPGVKIEDLEECIVGMIRDRFAVVRDMRARGLTMQAGKGVLG